GAARGGRRRGDDRHRSVPPTEPDHPRHRPADHRGGVERPLHPVHPAAAALAQRGAAVPDPCRQRRDRPGGRPGHPPAPRPYLLISLAMGLLTQSSVLGLLSAIGTPFLTATAVPLATLTGSELFIDVVRAVDLPGAAVALGDGRAGAFELLPLALTVLLPAAL